MADSNPANFANLDSTTVKEIASKGGQASHGGGFASMSKAKVKEIASMGGKASHEGKEEENGHAGSNKAADDPGRNANGTFKSGSETAKALGQLGGAPTAAAGDKDNGTDNQKSGRNPDGTFKKGSETARILGQEGGHAAAGTQ